MRKPKKPDKRPEPHEAFDTLDVPTPKAWEPREDESVRRYTAFRNYLELGPTRSMTGAVAAYKQQFSLGGSCSHLSKWAVLHEWHERAKAFDAHQGDLRAARRAHVHNAVEDIAVQNARQAGARLAAIATGHTVEIYVDGKKVEFKPIPSDDLKGAHIQSIDRLLGLAGIATTTPKQLEVSGPEGGPIELAPARPRTERLDEAKNLPADEKSRRFRQLVHEADE